MSVDYRLRALEHNFEYVRNILEWRFQRVISMFNVAQSYALQNKLKDAQKVLSDIALELCEMIKIVMLLSDQLDRE